jgi:hypothetical protein
MSVAATIFWVLTAGVGTYMVTIWRRHGGLSGDSASTHFPPARVFGHLGLALAGLVVWVAFLATSASGWAWIALAAAALAAVLGVLLVRRWAADGRLVMSGSDAAAGGLAEQHIQRLPVVLHGTFAGVTLVLVLLVALRG